MRFIKRQYGPGDVFGLLGSQLRVNRQREDLTAQLLSNGQITFPVAKLFEAILKMKCLRVEYR